jgi:hypothetical protein
MAGESVAIFYHLVGGRDAIFFRLLRLAGGRGSYIAGFIFPCIALLFRVRFSPKFCQFDIVTTWTEG